MGHLPTPVQQEWRKSVKMIKRYQKVCFKTNCPNCLNCPNGPNFKLAKHIQNLPAAQAAAQAAAGLMFRAQSLNHLDALGSHLPVRFPSDTGWENPQETHGLPQKIQIFFGKVL